MLVYSFGTARYPKKEFSVGHIGLEDLHGVDFQCLGGEIDRPIQEGRHFVGVDNEPGEASQGGLLVDPTGESEMRCRFPVGVRGRDDVP